MSKEAEIGIKRLIGISEQKKNLEKLRIEKSECHRLEAQSVLDTFGETISEETFHPSKNDGILRCKSVEIRRSTQPIKISTDELSGSVYMEQSIDPDSEKPQADIWIYFRDDLKEKEAGQELLYNISEHQISSIEGKLETFGQFKELSCILSAMRSGLSSTALSS